MGFFKWLFRLFVGTRPTAASVANADESVDDVADRLDRFGDRCRYVGDTAGENVAHAAARRARDARTVEHAWQIEREFLDQHGHKVPIAKPKAGRNAAGSAYVNYGDQSRVGGSVGWRNNNPGYIRCDDRLSRYGAIGCDGEYAIFADEPSGRGAMVEYLRQEYPGRTIHEALRQQLPSEAGPNAAERVLETAKLNADQKVEELTLDQIETVADTFPDVAGWQLGESVENPYTSQKRSNDDDRESNTNRSEPATFADANATDNS